MYVYVLFAERVFFFCTDNNVSFRNGLSKVEFIC